MNGFVRKSLVGHVRDGLEALAQSIVARCDRANGRPVMVMVDHDGSVYTPSADAIAATEWLALHPDALVGMYIGGVRRRAPVTEELVIEDLRARAREIGWIA